MPAILPLIFDGVLLVVLLFFFVMGAKRGFVLTLCSLLAVFVAFGGASFAAKSLSPKVGAAIQPRVQQALEQRMNDRLDAENGQTAPPGEDGELAPALSALRGLGFYEAIVESVRESVKESVGQAAASVTASVAAELSAAIAYLIVFLVFFVVILLAWTLLSRVLDLVARLPVLNTFNRVGGGVIGLAKGCMLLFVAAFLLQFTGNLLPEAVARETVLLKFFLTTNPVSVLFGR